MCVLFLSINSLYLNQIISYLLSFCISRKYILTKECLYICSGKQDTKKKEKSCFVLEDVTFSERDSVYSCFHFRINWQDKSCFLKKLIKMKWVILKTRKNIRRWSQQNQLYTKGKHVYFSGPVGRSCFKHKLDFISLCISSKRLLI